MDTKTLDTGTSVRSNLATIDKSPQNLLLIAGPCQIESASHARFMAEALSAIVSDLPIDFVFKASYDKANRTSGSSPRGVGLEQGVEILRDISEQVGCFVTTDVHELVELRDVAYVVDVLQIPAMLSRQTDLLMAAGKQARYAVNVKKGQFLEPRAMWWAVSKARMMSPNAQVWVTERGASFGYGNLVFDPRSLVWMRASGADKIIFDASHSSQTPGSAIDHSGGDRRMIEPLARAALAVGVDGLFVEVHDQPSESLSDGDIAFPLDDFRGMLERLLEVWEIGKRYRNPDAQMLEATAG